MKKKKITIFTLEKDGHLIVAGPGVHDAGRVLVALIGVGQDRVDVDVVELAVVVLLAGDEVEADRRDYDNADHHVDEARVFHHEGRGSSSPGYSQKVCAPAARTAVGYIDCGGGSLGGLMPELGRAKSVKFDESREMLIAGLERA